MAGFTDPPKTTDPVEILRYFQDKAYTPKSEQTGIASKPVTDDRTSGVMKFFADWWTESEEKVAKAREEIAPDMEELARRSAEEAALYRMEQGITQSLSPYAPRTSLRPPSRTEEITDAPKAAEEPTPVTVEEPGPEVVAPTDVDAAVAEALEEPAATEGGGLMSRRLDKGDEILPPESLFVAKEGTTAGDAERALYRDAYQAGLEGDELKAFMAQVAHESSSFGTTSERGYSWSKNYKDMPKAWKDRLKRDGVNANNATAENIFNSVYANRNGNGDFDSGDGSRYKGRGFIQLTGRDNYRTIGEDIGEDLEGNPNLMLDPEIARKASIAWWKRNVQGNVPDDDYTNLEAVSGLVNRGSATRRASGLTDRRKKLARYNEAITTPRISIRPVARPEAD